MADFGTVIRIALIFGLSALLKDLLDTVLSAIGVTAETCSAPATEVVNTARNCAYVSDTAQWVLAIVAVSVFVLAMQRAIVTSQAP